MTNQENGTKRNSTELNDQELNNVQGGLVGDDIGIARGGYMKIEMQKSKVSAQPKHMESVDDDE